MLPSYRVFPYEATLQEKGRCNPPMSKPPTRFQRVMETATRVCFAAGTVCLLVAMTAALLLAFVGVFPSPFILASMAVLALVVWMFHKQKPGRAAT